jgi:hypothetical protein
MILYNTVFTRKFECSCVENVPRLRDFETRVILKINCNFLLAVIIMVYVGQIREDEMW